jgi:hypothetical protein
MTYGKLQLTDDAVKQAALPTALPPEVHIRLAMSWPKRTAPARNRITERDAERRSRTADMGGNLVASVAACAVPERGDMRAATGPSRSVMAILLR